MAKRINRTITPPILTPFFRNRVERTLRERVATIENAGHASDEVAKITLENGKVVYARFFTNQSQQRLKRLHAFRKKVDSPPLAPLRKKSLSGRIVIYDEIEGEPLSEKKRINDQIDSKDAHKLAISLYKIHQHKTHKAQHRERAIRVLGKRLNEWIDRLKSTNLITESEQIILRKRIVKMPPVTMGLTHFDETPRNIMIRKDKKLFLIDEESMDYEIQELILARLYCDDRLKPTISAYRKLDPTLYQSYWSHRNFWNTTQYLRRASRMSRVLLYHADARKLIEKALNTN